MKHMWNIYFSRLAACFELVCSFMFCFHTKKTYGYVSGGQLKRALDYISKGNYCFKKKYKAVKKK